MTATLRNENGGVTEVSAAVSIEHTGAIRVSDVKEDSRFLRLPQLTPMEVARLGMFNLATFLDDFTARFTAGDRMDNAPRTHSAEAVNVGIVRFMELARERQALDAEWEFQEMCDSCGLYPAAHGKFCFTCLATKASLLMPRDGGQVS